MKLLVLTQAVDTNDSVLGFFVRWIQELSTRTEHLTVFALRTGAYDLPSTVTVVPLRPQGHRAPLRTALHFLVLSWKQRSQYDVIFVHMNQEYLLVAGLLWKLLGKRVYLWRNHYSGSFLTDLAALFCKKVFYTSKSSYTARYKKAVQMSVGVDTAVSSVAENVERTAHSMLFLGRFDQSKRPDLLIEALGLLAKEGVRFSATVVGGPSDPHSTYPEEVKARAHELGIIDRVSFVGAVPSPETYRYYRSHSIFVNASRSGMLDKTLFEAVVGGALPLSSSADMAEVAGPEFSYTHADPASLAKKLKEVLAFSEEERATAVRTLQEKIAPHALPLLADRLVQEMKA